MYTPESWEKNLDSDEAGIDEGEKYPLTTYWLFSLEH